MLKQRHPAGLYVLFFTEMWERFGFYSMLAIFVLYMEDRNNGQPFLQSNYSNIYGIYLATVYFTPFFGGLLADQKLGYRWSIILGAIAMASGYFLLAVDSLTFFFAGLAVLVVGNGLFKPNISTMVGKLYAPGDPRIDNAFTIFYMGINLGALAAPFAASWMRNRYGFHAAFAGAGVGMVVSLILFLLFQKFVVFVDAPASDSPNATPEVPPDVQRQRHIALLIIFFVVALFWMAFKQNGNTFNLWARDCTDRRPPEWMQSTLATTHLDKLLLDRQGLFAPELSQTINPFFVVLMSPIVVWFWLRLRAAGREPSTPAKVGWGMVLCAIAFVILAIGGLAGGDLGVIQDGRTFGLAALSITWLDPAGGSLAFGVWSGLASEVGRVTPWYLFSAYFVLTLGELCLSPMGLSLVSKLAAPKQRSAWMGGWFVATAVGGYLSGLIGGYWKTWPHSTFFAFLAGTSIFAMVILLLFLRRLKAAMPSKA